MLFAPGGHSPTGGVCRMVQRWNVCAIVFWRVVLWLWCPGRRGRGRGVRRLYVAVMWLRHADEC